MDANVNVNWYWYVNVMNVNRYVNQYVRVVKQVELELVKQVELELVKQVEPEVRFRRQLQP